MDKKEGDIENMPLEAELLELKAESVERLYAEGKRCIGCSEYCLVANHVFCDLTNRAIGDENKEVCCYWHKDKPLKLRGMK